MEYSAGRGTAAAEIKRKKTYTYILIAILCNILWGSAIPFINVGYRLFEIGPGKTASQMLFAGIRFFMAGCITAMIRSVSLKRPAVPRKANWDKVLKLALVQTVIQYVLFYIGVANTMSVKASIIQGLVAFISILIASYVFRYEKMNADKWLGGFLGVLGVIVVSWREGGISGSVSMLGEGALILSMISNAVSAGMIKKYGQTEDPVILNGWQFMAGGLVMAVIGLIAGGELSPQGGTAYLVLLYLACLSAAAYSLWSMLLKIYPISKIAVFMFLQPLFGVILGLLLVNQSMDIPVWQYMTALGLVCACIIIINYVPERGIGEESDPVARR